MSRPCRPTRVRWCLSPACFEPILVRATRFFCRRSPSRQVDWPSTSRPDQAPPSRHETCSKRVARPLTGPSTNPVLASKPLPDPRGLRNPGFVQIGISTSPNSHANLPPGRCQRMPHRTWRCNVGHRPGPSAVQSLRAMLAWDQVKEFWRTWLGCGPTAGSDRKPWRPPGRKTSLWP